MSSNWESLLTPQEIQAYGQFFSAANGGKSNVVNGQDAVTFFARSGIPNEILSDIWETADRDNLGYLTPETFSVALKLIACAQHGHEVADPILSTVVALPQFKGFNPDATASPISAKDIISPEEREKYLAIFRAHHPVQGVLDAEKARSIFSKSKLPNEYLAQIWNLADVRKSGNLNQTEFVIAMHYVARLMDRTITSLPAQLPAKVYGSAAGSIQSSPVLRRTSVVPAAMMSRQSTGSSFAPPTPHGQRGRAESIESLGSMAFASGSAPNWDVTPQEKARFDIFFDQVDTKRAGVIQGNEAVSFFKNSRLPDNELARVWDLADIEQNGQLTRDEFAVAMHLIQDRLTGKPLPNVLPKSLIPPSLSTARSAPVASSTPQQIFQSPPSITPPAQPLHPPQPSGPPPPQEDLLGDFGDNEELTTETNAVNQLQYQISNVQSSTAHIITQKDSVATSLEQSRKQKEDVEKQTAQIASVQQVERQRLVELQNLIKAEEPGWIQARQEHNAAQQQLNEARKQLEELNQTLSQGRTDSERLRQRVHEVQEETAGLVNQLERLRIYVNKTALPETTPPAAAPGLSFDDIFAPPAVTSPPATATAKVDDDFDAIFASPPPTTAAKRQPPPPPPPSRRTTVRRQETPQATKKARAPPPPPPSAAAMAATTAAAVAATGVAVAAVAHEAEHDESNTTTSSDTEGSSEDASSPTTEAPTAATVPIETPFADAETESDEEKSADHAEKAPDTTTAGAAQEQPAQKVATDVSTVEPSSDTATKSDEEQSLEQPAEAAKTTTIDAAATEEEEKSPESSPKDIAITEAAPEAPSDTIDETKSEETQALGNAPEIPKTTADTAKVEAPHEALPKDVATAEAPSDTTNAAKAEEPQSLENKSPDSVPVKEAVVPTEKTESPDKDLDSHAEVSSVVQDVEPPKEEELVTSEVLADKVTPEIAEAVSSEPFANQDNAETKSKDIQGTDKDEKDTLQDPESNTIDAPVSSQNETIPSESRTIEAVIAPVTESTGAAISSNDAKNTDQDSSTALPEQEKPVASDNEDKTDDCAPPREKNVAEKEMARGDSIDAVDTTTSNSDDDAISASPKEEVEPADTVTGSQGDAEKKVQETTVGVEEEALEADKFKDAQDVEQDGTDVERQAKDKESDTDIDEFLSVDGNESDDQPKDEKAKFDNNPDASKANMQDIKEDRPMDEQTEPTNNEDEETQYPVLDGERAEGSSINAKEERGSQGPSNDAKDDSVESKRDEPHERENTSHTEAPGNVSDSDLISKEPVEHVDEEGSVMHKEPEQGLSSHDKAKEEQAKEQLANDDFDAVFMERPSDKDRSSSDEGGGESFEIISSTTSPKEQQAPAIDEFDSAFASELQDAKVVNDSSLFNQDDFGAAFAEELTDAKVVQNSDEKEAKQQGDNKLSWASNFGGFSFDFDTKKNDDDWDSIFGGDDGKAGEPEHVGFEDAFSASFNNSNNSSSSNNNQPEAAAESNVKEIQQEQGTVANSTLDELVMMGFDRDLAKDALERYDQDLQKATNFLLDLAAK